MFFPLMFRFGLMDNDQGLCGSYTIGESRVYVACILASLSLSESPVNHCTNTLRLGF